MSDEWTKDDAGNLIANPLAGWSTMTLGTVLGLSLEFWNPGDQRQTPTGRLQLAMSPAQAERLALALQRAAAALLRRPNGPPS
jgi:hypothetical protein